MENLKNAVASSNVKDAKNISSKGTKVTIEIEDGVAKRVSIVNNIRYTNSEEQECKSSEEIVELAAKKALRDYEFGKPLDAIRQWEEDWRQEARLGAMTGLKKAMDTRKISEFSAVDPQDDIYHAHAYYYAKKSLMTNGRRMRTGIALSERAVRQFAHAKNFLAKHPDGKWTEKDLDKLAEKMWLKSHDAVKKVIADYIAYSSMTVISMEEERPGFDRSVTWEETAERPISEEEISENENKKTQSFLWKVFWEADTLSKKQKTILVQYLGLFGTEKVKVNDLAKANGMKPRVLTEAIVEYVELLKKYIVGECGYSSLQEILCEQ